MPSGRGKAPALTNESRNNAHIALTRKAGAGSSSYVRLERPVPTKEVAPHVGTDRVVRRRGHGEAPEAQRGADAVGRDEAARGREARFPAGGQREEPQDVRGALRQP